MCWHVDLLVLQGEQLLLFHFNEVECIGYCMVKDKGKVVPVLN
jgi:hypothetical protein